MKTNKHMTTKELEAKILKIQKTPTLKDEVKNRLNKLPKVVAM